MVNQALDERRALLAKRIISARIYLLIAICLTFANIIGVCLEGKIFWLHLPYRITSAQALFEFGRTMMSVGDAIRPGMMIIFGGLSALILFFFICAWFNLNKSRVWTSACYYGLIIDLLATMLLTLFNLTAGTLSLVLFFVDILIHGFVVIPLGRAKKAAYGLIVLPEQEIEGDPYAEFRNDGGDLGASDPDVSEDTDGNASNGTESE